MRIDLFLKKSQLIKQRTIAQEACSRGMVKVNGHVAKPAKEITVGDQITLNLHDSELTVRVVQIPRGNVSRSQTADLYDIIQSTPLNYND